MTSLYPSASMTYEERVYVALRGVLFFLGIGMQVYGLFPSISAFGPGLGLWALLLVSIGTVCIAVSALTGRPPISRTMVWILPLDLVSIAIYTWLLAPKDAVFGVYVLLVVLYAMITSPRISLLAAIAFTTVYLAGHALSKSDTTLDLALAGLEGVSLLVVGYIASSATRRKREKDLEVARALKDRQLANEKLARRVGELHAVAEVTDIIHSSLDFDAVGPLVLDIILKVLDFSALAIFVVDKDKSETLFSASVGIPDTASDHGGGPDLGEVENHLTCQRVFDHSRLTVLFCATNEDMERLGEDDLLVVHTLASELVVAVENSRLYKLTRRLAVTDELTGLSNYRHMQQRLDEELTRARRYGKPLSLAMIDTDDFKGFNDAHGHLAGDKALSEFAGVFASVVREVDLVARYGGEEFAVILPETDVAGALAAAEKIREAFAGHRFADASGQRCCPLTLSIGYATFPTHAGDKEALLRESDDALYRAKNGGKNRVCAPLRTDMAETTSGD